MTKYIYTEQGGTQIQVIADDMYVGEGGELVFKRTYKNMGIADSPRLGSLTVFRIVANGEWVDVEVTPKHVWGDEA